MTGAVLIVEGPDLPPHVGPNPQVSVSSTAQSSGGGASSFYHSNPPPAFKSVIPKSKGATHTIKVVRATMETSRTGKVEFEQETQMHIDLTENTANVEHVIQEVKQLWGDSYVLVTVDGLQLEDCEGTQGMAHLT